MVPPKKDAFADLFLTAVGTNRKSDAAPMNELRPAAPMATATRPTWSDLDVLSPNVSSNVSRNLTPVAKNTSSADPFSFFDVENNLPKRLTPQSTKASLANPIQGDSLLDDEFTDAFVAVSQSPSNDSLQTESVDAKNGKHEKVLKQSSMRESEPNSHIQDAPKSRDTVLAELLDIGFSVGDSNEAIECVGIDLQNCVNYIMSKNSSGSIKRGLDISQSRQKPPDLNAKLNDVSTKLYSTASWFLDKSKKTVIGGINNLQQQHLASQTSDGRPSWMKNQHKYKSGAIEKKNGQNLEDYGTDEENIDAEEIQKIIAQQQKRERERQRERLSRSSAQYSPSPFPELELSESPQLLRRGTPKSRQEATVLDSNPPEFNSLPQLSQSKKISRNELKMPSAKQPTPAPIESVDLLGLTSDTSSPSPAQRFKQNQLMSTRDDSYNIPTRRSQTATAKVSASRKATNESLNAFQQSDYETFKEKGTSAFTRGDFHDALEAYTKSLESIPEKHELRIVLTSNLALTAIKLGNYRLANDYCDEGLALVGDSYADPVWQINSKGIKYWFIKLLMRKAESLELMERFPDAMKYLMLLISKYNVTDLKIMEARRRVEKIVNPPKKQHKPQPKLQPKSSSPNKPTASSEKVTRIRQQHEKEKREEEMKFRLHDQINEKIILWSNGKETNIRALLMSLSDVLPQRLGFSFITDKVITMNDLMLTKKVRINYMKVISSIHPDKLDSFSVEDRMICQLVFVTLNKAWDEFKVQNQIA